MATTEFVAAIELSSSMVTGIAGRKKSDGSVQVLAYAQEEASSFIRKGVIFNLDKTTQCLQNIIRKLEEELKETIARVYVTIGGQSIRTIRNAVSRDLGESTIVTQDLVDAIYDENSASKLPDMEILDVVPQEYKIGNTLQVDPVGVAGNSIEGRFLNITARAILKNNLEHCCKQAKITIAETFITPLVTGKAVLTENEQRSGCALIDLGADTTTVSVYKGSILHFLSVLPLGGSSITRDLTSLQIEEDEAERLKKLHGNALYEEVENAEPVTYQLEENNRSIEASALNNIVEARAEEIIANIYHQLELSGYEDKLHAGVVFTGGASNLKNLDKAFSKKTKIEKVRMAQTPRFAVHTSISAWKKDGSRNGLFGIFLENTSNCCEEEKPAPVVVPPVAEEPVTPVAPTPAPTPTQETFFTSVDDSWKEQEERAKLEKKRLEEEERQRKKDEKIRRDAEKKAREQEERDRKKAEKEARKEAEGGGWISKIANKLNNVSKDLFDDQDMK